MTITVEYFAQALTIAGVASESLSFDGPVALSEFVAELARRHGPKLRELLLSGNELSRTVIFAVDDQQVPPGENAMLQGGERVLIVPPISGGQP